MQFVITGNENSFRIRNSFDEFQPFFIPQGKTGGAQRIAIYGMIRNDGDSNEIIFVRISGLRIQNMMVNVSLEQVQGLFPFE